MKKIVVCGAGVMGSGIAQVCAKAGYEVALWDLTVELAQRGKDGIAAGLDTCWFNPEGKNAPEDMPIDYQIKQLDELIDLVLGA